MDKDEINIPQRGRPRKSREMDFQSPSPAPHERTQIDFEGMLDVGGEESVNDLLQREYRKYVDRNKLDINQNNLENYLKLKDLNRKWGVRGDKARFDFEKKDGDTRREVFQSQGQILSHISSIFPDKCVSDDFPVPYAGEENTKRRDAQIEMNLGLAARDVSECDEFLVNQLKGGESGCGGAANWAERYSKDERSLWGAIGSGNARNEGGNENAPQMAQTHSPTYGAGERDSCRDDEKQGDACAQNAGQGGATGRRGSVPDTDCCAERYGSQDANINKSSEFSPRFGARHEGDFYGLEPRQSSHRSMYSAGQVEMPVDYSQQRFYTRDQKVVGMPGKHSAGTYGRTQRGEPVYQYGMHDYYDYIQNDGSGHAFLAPGYGFAAQAGEQPDASGFSMCRQGRYQGRMHRTESFPGHKRGDRDGFSQKRAEESFAEQKDAIEFEMAQQAASWHNDSAGYQSSVPYAMGIDGRRFQGGRHASDVVQDMHPSFESPHLYQQQVEASEGDKFSAGDQGIAQYINSKYSAGTSLGQTLSHSSNVSSFEPNPSNPLFQNYSMWVNRKKRKNNPLLWQYINQGHSFVHPSKYSNLDYVHKKMYLGTITQIPIEKNNHQILPLFLNSTSNTPEFVKIGSIFLERTRGLNYDNVTVMQLKNLMKEFGLCHNGKKTELIERVKTTVEKIEQKMSNKKDVQSAESHPPETESREETENVDMDDVADDAAFMYF